MNNLGLFVFVSLLAPCGIDPSEKVISDWKSNYESTQNSAVEGSVIIDESNKRNEELTVEKTKRYEFLGRGEFKKVAGNNGNNGVAVTNPFYSFFLMKDESGGRWKVLELFQDEDHEKKSTLGKSFRKFFYPDYSFGQNHLYELYLNKKITLDYKKSDGPLADFACAIIIDEKKAQIFRGTITLNMVDGSRLVGFSGAIEALKVRRIQKNKKETLSDASVEYKIEAHDHYSFDDQEVHLSQSSVVRVRLVKMQDDSEFYLAKYGLPEPHGSRKVGPALNPYVLYGFGSLLIFTVLIFIIKRIVTFKTQGD